MGRQMSHVEAEVDLTEVERRPLVTREVEGVAGVCDGYCIRRDRIT